MKIYTSYFGNSKALAQAGVMIVSVARWQPRFLTGLRTMLDVAPTVWMLKQATHEQYISSYKDILSQTDAQLFLKRLEQMSGGRDVALCCYEKPWEFCHRHMLSEFLTSQTGVEITEFPTSATPPPPPKPREPSLFD